MTYDPDSLDARDPSFIRTILPAIAALNRHYLRLQVEGVENLPDDQALFVSNHNGGMTGPDLACTMGTLWTNLGVERRIYALAHDFAMRSVKPFGKILQRVGGIRACPENALRVFQSGGSALVYPGGDLEAYRHSKDRDRIVLGERTGFVRVAQEAGVSIVPIVAHGAHRSAYIFDDGEWIARALRLQSWARLRRFPLAFAFPWGLALGPWTPYLPLPFRVRLKILPRVPVEPGSDPAVVREEISSKMQLALDELAERARRKN